jgi:hypothetical protein
VVCFHVSDAARVTILLQAKNRIIVFELCLGAKRIGVGMDRLQPFDVKPVVFVVYGMSMDIDIGQPGAKREKNHHDHYPKYLVTHE